METMVLLVFLAIVWAAVGVYWLRTRAPSPSMNLGSYTRRLSSLDAVRPRAAAPVSPLRGAGSSAGQRGQGPAGPPGHSLTEPARRADPSTQPRRGVSSERARLRRRNVLLALVALAAATLVGVFTVGGSTLILIHLAADALLLGFVLLLVQYQREIELDRTRHLPVYAAPRHPLMATGTEGR